MAGLFITKLVREAHELNVDPNSSSKTIGALIDDCIIDMIAEGQEMHSITVNLEPEDWDKIKGEVKLAGDRVDWGAEIKPTKLKKTA